MTEFGLAPDVRKTYEEELSSSERGEREPYGIKLTGADESTDRHCYAGLLTQAH